MRSSKSSRPLGRKRHFQNHGNVLPQAMTEVPSLAALCFYLSLSTTILSVSLESKLHTPPRSAVLWLLFRRETRYNLQSWEQSSPATHSLPVLCLSSHNTAALFLISSPNKSSFDSFPNFSGRSPLRSIFFLLTEHPQPPDHTKTFSLVLYHSTWNLNRLWYLMSYLEVPR